MNGFLIKKTFYDLWDNIILVVLLNLGYILLLGVGALVIQFVMPLFSALGALDILMVLLVTIAIGALFGVYSGGVSQVMFQVAAEKRPPLSALLGGIRETWKQGALYGILGAVLLLLLFFSFPFYLSFGGPVGVIGAAVVIWIIVLVSLALQYFFAIRSQLDDKVGKVLKKCFLIFFDNAGFTIALFLVALATAGLSLFVAMLVPGITGIILLQNEALRFRLLKYDWLEANPTADRRLVPWGELLTAEREKLGGRSLRSLFFPWKS